MVIGNPEGLTGTVSDGIIAAFRKNRDIIQITAPISPGSSGSPLLDESGDVIGIVTANYGEGQNLNFAISADSIRDLIAKKGVALRPENPQNKNPLGVTLRQAWQKLKTKDYLGASTLFNLSIAAQPYNAEAWIGSGIADEGLGDFDQALRDYSRAIELEPNLGVGYELRAKLFDLLGEHDQASADRKKAKLLGER